MTSSKPRRGVMLSTALRPVIPKRRENVPGPTRYTIPYLSARINAFFGPAPYCLWIEVISFYRQINPEALVRFGSLL
jgi:hypothetical protein